jgi:hypothetical protein
MARKKTEHETALDRFKVSSSLFQAQRERELEDVRFAMGEQWPEDVKAQRQGGQQIGNMPPIPARPCLEINKLRQPLQQVENQARQARLALTFAPRGNGASRDIAEAYEDIARAIQTDSRAQIARNWAFKRAITAGLGWYRILYEYANDGDFDLDLVYKRILNQASVYPDPYAEEPDWSDGQYCFLTQWLTLPEYKRQFGDSHLADIDEDAFSDLVEHASEWTSTDGTDEGRRVQIAEYFYYSYDEITLTQGQDGKAYEHLPEGMVPTIGLDGKPVTRKQRSSRVDWCKLNAVEILEQQPWLGKYIPIIPVLGDEYNLNGERRWEGIVRPARDACRSYLYMRSAQVEGVGLAPRAPWVGYVETIEGFEDVWNQSNTRNFAMLPIKMVRDGTGSALPPPNRNVVEPAIQAITLAAHEADGDIKATTGLFDPSLGNLNPSDRSGKAILALQKQGDQSSGGYLDSLAQISMAYEGRVLMDLIPKVYDRPGRIVPTKGEDDQTSSVMLNQPFVQNGQQPQAVPPGTPGAKTIDLSRGQYTIVPTVGKSHTTRREEGADAMSQLIEAAPQLAPMISDLWVGDMDFPGAKSIADRLKKMLPPQLQDNPQDPEIQLAALKQQAGQAQQLLDAMTRELDAKNQIIETEAVKAQQTVTIKQMELASDEKIQNMKIEADLLKTQATIAASQAEANIQAQLLQLQQELGLVKEVQMAREAQAHEAAMAGMSHQQALEQQQAQGQIGMQQQDLKGQQAMDQQAQAAALSPPEETPA